MAELGHAGVLLHRQMGAALIKGDVFPDEVGLRKADFYIAEFVDLSPMDIAVFPIVMDARLGGVERSLDRRDGGKEFVLDINQVHRFRRHIFIHRSDGGHRVSHHADLADCQRVFVFADG